MTPADRKPFLEIVLGFAELRGKKLSAPALELYWRSMQSWSIEDFRAAAERLVLIEEFMPTPKHFEDLRKAGRSTAGEAWIEARRHVVWGLHGAKLSEDCPPLLAQSIRAIGGPNVVYMCDEDKLVFLERRFCEHFETLQDATDTRQALPQIAVPPERLALHLGAVQKRLTQGGAR